jgi:hypothetical protein
MHKVTFEDVQRIVVCRLYGFLQDEDASAFSKDLSALIAKVRAGGGPLLFLIDNREGHVASPSAAAKLGEMLRETRTPGDRTAIVVPNSLGKLQAKRVTTSDHEVFLSENAARTWLTAYQRSAPG